MAKTGRRRHLVSIVVEYFRSAAAPDNADDRRFNAMSRQMQKKTMRDFDKQVDADAFAWRQRQKMRARG